MSPFFSQVPIGWMSAESTNRQKSLVLSLPSSRRRSLAPIKPITVAMQVEVELRGSRASSFIPTLKSLEGGIRDWRTNTSCEHTVEFAFKMTSPDWFYFRLTCLKQLGGAETDDVSFKYSSHVNDSITAAEKTHRCFTNSLRSHTPLKVQSLYL